MALKNLNTPEMWDAIYEDEATNAWRNNVVTFAKISAVVGTGKRVLDVGCGQGLLLDKLRENGNATYGLDLSRVAIERIERNGHNGLVKRIEDLTPEDLGLFDVVILANVLEHLDNAPLVIQRALSVLKPNGFIVGEVPDDCISSEEEMTHTAVYNYYSLRQLLGEDAFIEKFEENFYGDVSSGGAINLYHSKFKALFFVKEKL